MSETLSTETLSTETVLTGQDHIAGSALAEPSREQLEFRLDDEMLRAAVDTLKKAAPKEPIVLSATADTLTVRAGHHETSFFLRSRGGVLDSADLETDRALRGHNKFYGAYLRAGGILSEETAQEAVKIGWREMFEHHAKKLITTSSADDLFKLLDRAPASRTGHGIDREGER